MHFENSLSKSRKETRRWNEDYSSPSFLQIQSLRNVRVCMIYEKVPPSETYENRKLISFSLRVFLIQFHACTNQLHFCREPICGWILFSWLARRFWLLALATWLFHFFSCATCTTVSLYAIKHLSIRLSACEPCGLFSELIFTSNSKGLNHASETIRSFCARGIERAALCLLRAAIYQRQNAWMALRV